MAAVAVAVVEAGNQKSEPSTLYKIVTEYNTVHVS